VHRANTVYLASDGIRNRVAKKFQDFFCHQNWNVGVVEEPIHAFLEEDARPRIRWLPPIGRGKYLADPFGIVQGGRTYGFCEEFDYTSYKGVVSFFDLSGLDDLRPPSTVLEMPFHMSYPYIFPFEGHVYCVPETHEAKEISLYRAEEFPYRWIKISTLVPGFAGVDPTVFSFGGRWWLASTDGDDGPNTRLFVWHAESLRGPWRPHAANPVRLGANGTRPAGTPFRHKGELYRPAMDSSRTYGRRIVLNRIVKLTPSEFEEEKARLVEPPKKGRYRDGIHTISAVGNWTLVDGLQITFQRVEFQMTVEKERRELLGRVTPLWHKN